MKFSWLAWCRIISKNLLFNLSNSNLQWTIFTIWGQYWTPSPSFQKICLLLTALNAFNCPEKYSLRRCNMESFHISLESLSSFLKYHCLYCSNIKVSLISWILRVSHSTSTVSSTWFCKRYNVVQVFKCLVAEFSPLCPYNSEMLNSSICWATR